MPHKKATHAAATDSRLPRGPHKLTRHQVAEHQRQRLMRSLVDVVGEQGYAACTVSDVVARAGVSRRAFYEHFPDKKACYLAAYDAIVADVLNSVSNAYRGAGSPSERATDALTTLFERSLVNLHALRMVMVEIGAIGPDGIARRERLLGTYEQRLRKALGIPAHAGTVPNPVLRAIVGGMNGVLYTQARADSGRLLPELVPELVAWITSYYPAPASLLALPSKPPSRRGKHAFGGRAPGTLASGTSSKARRGLSRGEPQNSKGLVVHSQRERILDAIANLSFRSGYGAFTVDDIAKDASVSLATFYEHFTDKEDAFLVAYEAGHSKGLAMVEHAFDTARDWRTGVRAGIGSLFAFLASEPAFAHLALVDALIATPRTAERSNRGTTAYAQMLLPGLDQRQRQAQPALVTIEAIAGGIFELCLSYALKGRIGALPELVPRASYFALAPFIGAKEAGRIATSDLRS